MFVLLTFAACSERGLRHAITPVTPGDRFLSATYNHFEGGVLFHDLEYGLNVLWESSFKQGRVYKENAGFFVSQGLVILPNKENTSQSARLSGLPVQIIDNKLYIQFEGNLLEVLGIIHTHIEGMPEPSPRVDYQYGYMGIHNYVMGYIDIFDAYKDAQGYEVSSRLGPRKAYETIPSHVRNSAPKLKTADLAVLSH